MSYKSAAVSVGDTIQYPISSLEDLLNSLPMLIKATHVELLMSLPRVRCQSNVFCSSKFSKRNSIVGTVMCKKSILDQNWCLFAHCDISFLFSSVSLFI